MLRSVQDLSMASAQAGWPLTNTGSAFQNNPNLEGLDATILDARLANAAPGIGLGTLYVKALSDTGDCNYLPSHRANYPQPLLSYGVVTSIPLPTPPPPNQQTNLSIGSQELRIRQVGYCSALCVTPSSAVAIAVGTLLTSDGNGNLQPFQPPSAAPTPTVTTVGTTGAATWGYKLVAVGYDGTYSAAGTEGTTGSGNGNATLTNANYQQVSWTPVADAAYYIIVRTTSGGTPATTGVVGIVPNSVTTFNDTGLAISENTSTTVFWPKLSAPSAPTVAQVSGATAGTTTNTYKVTAIGANGIWSAESSATSLATSNATLSVTNANKITWTAVTGAAYYAIDRTAAGGTPSTTGLIGYSNSPTAGFLDYGQAATTFATPVQTVPDPTPRPGRTLAIAVGTLAAGTTTPTLTAVYVGGF